METLVMLVSVILDVYIPIWYKHRNVIKRYCVWGNS
jgi:hypothetical protein